MGYKSRLRRHIHCCTLNLIIGKLYDMYLMVHGLADIFLFVIAYRTLQKKAKKK